MKKMLKWVGIAALTPVLLFTILAALLYCPPVQNWAVRQVAAIASEKLGMEITVGHVNLEFPLDLGIDGFRAIKPSETHPQQGDTIADITHLVADIQLAPLLSKRVVINELSLHDARINTLGLISDLQIRGDLSELWLSSHGIDLEGQTVEVNGARLSQANVDITLTDTAATDTTTTAVRWKINADSLTIRQTTVSVHLQNDTLLVEGWLAKAVARHAHIDLGEKVYKVASLDWHEGRLNYHNRYKPATDGLDYNHLAISGIRLGVDNINYTPQGLSLYVRQTAMKEKSGIEVTELTGGVTLDSTFNNIRLPQTTLRTRDSNIAAEADIDFTAFDAETPGRMKLRLLAQMGKQDLFRIYGQLPQKFMERFPNRPLIVRGSLDGNMRHMEVTGLDINLPTALHANIKGTASNLTDISRLKASLQVEATTKELNFLTAFIDPTMSGVYRIPDGITLDGRLTADGTHYGATLTAHDGKGSVSLKGDATIPLNAKGEMVTSLLSYDADISIDQINVHHFLPKDSIYTLSADVKASGYGTDLFSPRSRLQAEASVRMLKYGYMNLNNLTATADLHDSRAQVALTGHNDIFDGTLDADLLLNSQLIDGTVTADLTKADLYQIRIAQKPLTIGMRGSMKVKSDMKLTHYISGRMDDVYVKDARKTYTPESVGLLVKAYPDTLVVRAQSGDFILKLDSKGSYERLLAQTSKLAETATAQYEQKIIDQPAIKALLPTMRLHLESKRNNPVANLLRAMGTDFKELSLDLDTSPETGINGNSHLYSLVYDSTRIDTIRLNLKQKGDRLTYNGQIRNNKKNPQFVFNALFDGHFHEHGALAGLRYYDDKDRLGVRVGATAEMEHDGTRLRLMPERPTLGYKEYNLNKDNYIFLGSDKKIQAKIDLVADDKAGLKIYTENQDPTMLQDLTLSLNRINLGELTSVLPYMPRITGYLNGDFHILQDQNEKFSIASDMGVANMTYEGSPIGNISTEMVYLQKESNGTHQQADTHAIEARLMLNEEEFGLLSGTYQNEGEGNIQATFDMTRLPLSLVNGFIPDQIVGLEGYGEGRVTIKGTVRHPHVNGEMYVDSAYLVSIPYGVSMRFDNDPVRIVDSRLLLENFGLYAYNDQPLNLMGSIDFSDTRNMTIDMRMRALNLQLINAKQKAKSIAFGKAYVDLFARMQGPLERLNIRGRLNLLGSTDMTYMLLDSPLSADNRLDELVKFTDFNDTTQTVVTRPVPESLSMELSINVSEGAHIVCNLNPEQTNYVDLMGGGDLRMRYNSEGLNLTGRYTVNSGEMKYSLPVIPLKTFTIKNGSYVEFTGDPMNPRLNITATERTKAAINGGNGAGRSVLFDCGVVITKTLKDMGLQFTIEAPEDNSINGELTTMTTEERGKVAVTMLTTGMYLANGDTQNFTMNSALSSFLQSEINSITGSALKTLDLSVGIDNATDAAGSMYTDYSFKFAKRFFNNRLKVELGGKVSSNNNSALGQKQSFFDNVTMEYRLNQNATQSVKLYYQQNVYDWIEGYNSLYGVGFIWRRKLESFLDILTFWKKEQRPMMMQPRNQQPASQQPAQQPAARRDTTAADSTRKEATQ